jgi:two-component system cell cycle sensor histidine kinase/response regulator CckA
VYGIVKQSNGFIWVYSEPGCGTTFKVYLPLAEETPVEREPEIAELPHGHETVLLVEDSPALRAVARTILESQSYVVLEAASASEALALVEHHDGRIDLLLTDVVMPGISGRVLAEQFATQRPDAKVLYMSGYTDDAIVRHGVLRAGVPYLQKPFGPDSLIRKVRAVLDGTPGHRSVA